MQINFCKYQGAGNDFVLIDNRTTALPLTREQVAFLCDRRFGIGADGLMTLENDPAGTEFYMRYYNSDGGESTMCGNGGRCIALFAHHLGVGGKTKIFNSSDGAHQVEMLRVDGAEADVRLRMIDVERVENLSGGGEFVQTGSPHYVEFVDDTAAVDVKQRGAQVRHFPGFASIGGVNANFVQILAPGALRVRTFERGVEAETFACGTGVTASALAAHALHQPGCRDFTIEAVGGKLRVTFDKTAAGGFTNVQLTGPARRVFEGEIEI